MKPVLKNDLNDELKTILPEKYKYLDLFHSLRKHLQTYLKHFSSDEKNWFKKEHSLNLKNKKKAKFLEMVPYVVKKRNCAGFLFILSKEPGLSLSEIGTRMGVPSPTIHRARILLEKIELIVIHYEIPGLTKCYLNDGNIKSNGVPPVLNVLSLVMDMMLEQHGNNVIKEITSVNENVQKEILRRSREPTKK